MKKRFFDINNWQKYGGIGTAEFKLYDSVGKQVSRNPIRGDYMRIKIPGPHRNGHIAYDWVCITNISSEFLNWENELCLITCKPSSSPLDKNPDIKHFYSCDSSNTFIISKIKNHIKVGVYGRNEIPNLPQKGLFNKIRNFFVSLGGTGGVVKFQWKRLAEGLLKSL